MASEGRNKHARKDQGCRRRTRVRAGGRVRKALNFGSEEVESASRFSESHKLALQKKMEGGSEGGAGGWGGVKRARQTGTLRDRLPDSDRGSAVPFLQ